MLRKLKLIMLQKCYIIMFIFGLLSVNSTVITRNSEDENSKHFLMMNH